MSPARPAGPALPDELARAPAGARHDAVARPGPSRNSATAISPGSSSSGSRRRASIRMQRGALDGWEATPHQRFERLLRETGVFAGLLITDKDDCGSVYAPARRDLRLAELSRSGRSRPSPAGRCSAG